MGIYRGPGGSGDATNDASSETRLAVEARDAAIAAKVAAETAQAAAELAETNAETAETNAETAETNAETAATNAASSASAASTSATNAAASASTATTQASNASSSASAAATSASNASSSASTATTQASNASTSATNASNSATAAAASATSAAASYDAFDDRYLGAKSSNPTVDNDGNALITGALYFNTVVPETRVWTGTVWNALSAAGSSVSTFNTRTGDVTLTSSDVTTALTYTPLAPSAIGTTVQAYDAQLADVAGLTPSDNGVIIGNGTNFVVESGATVRTSLGLGTAATTAATDYATSAQGAKADTALQPAAIGVSVQAYDADLAAFALKTAPTGAVVGTSDTQTLTNKTIALGSNTVSGTLAEFNTAVTDADFASIAGTETLTNKTLTSPTISGGTINNASVGASTASSGAFTTLSASGAFSANGGATLGDASGDALTINSSAVSIPNGLNFDSNTLVIDATNNRIAVNGSDSSVGGGQMVVNQANNNGLVINQTVSGNGASIYLRNAADTTINNFNFTNSGVRFFDVGTNSERMRIDSSGNVGIGTASPATKLNIYGTSTQELRISTNTAGDTRLGFDIQGAYYNWIDNYRASGAMAFATNNTERMRISDAGNVGIGTSSPSYKLHVVGGQTRLDVSSAGTSLVCLGTGSNFQVDHSTSGYATLINSANSGAAMIFKGSSESMRIDSSGNLLVGTTTSANSPPNGICTTNPSGATSLNIGHGNGTPSGFGYMQYAYNGTTIGYISQNGTTAVAYNTTSDYRLKENITPMTGALDTVAQLKPCTYTWKADGSDGQGFIAHELQEVVPDCVTGEKDAVDAEGNPVYQGIDTSFLVATLTAAIQELNAKVDSLQAELNTLKG